MKAKKVAVGDRGPREIVDRTVGNFLGIFLQVDCARQWTANVNTDYRQRLHCFSVVLWRKARALLLLGFPLVGPIHFGPRAQTPIRAFSVDCDFHNL